MLQKYTSFMGTFCNFYQLFFVEYHLYMDFGLLDVYLLLPTEKGGQIQSQTRKKKQYKHNITLVIIGNLVN